MPWIPMRTTELGSPATSVLVVAGNEHVAAKIEAILRGISRWRVVVGAAADLATLVDDRHPACIVAAMPPADAARALEALGGLSRIPPVILLAPEPHAAWTREARRAGVRAVLGSDATAEELTGAIAATMAGLIVLHPDALSVRPTRVSGSHGAGRGTALTPRELEILEMLAEGMSNLAIADRLGISGYTVKFHVAAILAKLEVSSRTEAVTLGIRLGLISL